MTNEKSLQITAAGETDIVFTRRFDAPRHLVFQALMTPKYVKRWLLGPPGWSLDVCDIDPRVGGAYRYEWNGKGKHMGMGGVFLTFDPPAGYSCTEQFDDPWYKGEATATTALEEKDGQTTMTVTIRYESRAVRDKVMQSNMESGVAMSYDRLAELLPEVTAD